MLELEGVTHRHVEARGMRFHVAEAGDPQAPPVFLTHGWPQHWWSWRHVIEALAPAYRLIAWDLRGLGWSDPAPDGDYTKTAMAEDLLGLMDALEVERAGLIGHDWGAFSGMIACLKAPERFRGQSDAEIFAEDLQTVGIDASKWTNSDSDRIVPLAEE